MPIVKVQATKMSKGNVSFISLVERGANRIPFKIIKQEKPMAGHFAGLDLGNIFNTRKAETPPVTPEVVAVVTMKGEGFDSIKSQIEGLGFAVSDAEEMEDGSVVFKQGDMDGETTVVRLSDHIGLVTKGFSPYSMDMAVAEDFSFADACATQGFYPGIRVVMDVLSSSIGSIAQKAESPAAGAKAIGKLFDEVKTYVTSFAAGLPTKAFKLETIEPEVSDPAPEAEQAPAEEGTQEPVVATDGVAGDQGEAAGDDGDAGDGTPVKKSEATPAENEPKGLTEEQVGSIVSARVEGAVSDIAKKLEESLAGVTKGFQDSLKEVAGAVEGLVGRVEKAEQAAEAAKTAVAGTVVPGSESGDAEPVTRKTETGSSGGTFDTAYMGNVRKRASR